MDIPDKIALRMILERMDAEEIEYWIDEDGKVRFKHDLHPRIDAITEKIFAHRSAGRWVIYDEAGCDRAPILIQVLEENSLEFLDEPMGIGAELKGCSIHWYPTDEHTPDDVMAEVSRRNCAKLLQLPCDRVAQ